MGWHDEPVSYIEGIDILTHYMEKGYQGFIIAYSYYEYTDSLESFHHANIDINCAIRRVNLKFQDEREKIEELGNYLATIRSLELKKAIE